MTYVKVLAILAVLAGIAAFSYNKGIEHNEAIHVERERDGLLAYAAKIAEGVEQHEQNQLLINALTADNKRLRIHLPTSCPGSQDSSGEAGVLSANLDAAFAELQEEAGKLFQRCDQLNIDAIQRNAGS